MNDNPPRIPIMRAPNRLLLCTLLLAGPLLGAQERREPSAARFHVQAARRALDADTAMARQQERFYPYLVGYVALYTNDLAAAERELTRAVSMQGNDDDPFMHALLAMTYEKLNQPARARETYQKAYELATGHNPPAVFTRPFARSKLGLSAPEP